MLLEAPSANSPKGLIVAGAGAAGIAAAIAAARRGVRVALLEQTSEIGGIVAHGLIHTIGGLHDSQGHLLNRGLPVELVERLTAADDSTRPRKMGRVWVLNACPTAYLKVVKDWIAEEANIELFLEATSIHAGIDGDRVGSVEFFSQGKRHSFQPSALIDCTGTASVIASLGHDHVIEDGHGALAGLIVRLRGVKSADLVFPKNVIVQRRIQSAVTSGALPPECSGVWIDSGVYSDEVYLKWSVAVGKDSTAQEEAIRQERFEGALKKLVGFLASFPAFASAVVVQQGRMSSRGGIRAKGEYQLTGDDVRALRKFPDAACQCAWPIEYWNPEKGVQMEYLEADGAYDIPLRSLKAAHFQNLWVAGKCLSADHRAQASARVSGCCWAMGQAAAHAAASI